MRCLKLSLCRGMYFLKLILYDLLRTYNLLHYSKFFAVTSIRINGKYTENAQYAQKQKRAPLINQKLKLLTLDHSQKKCIVIKTGVILPKYNSFPVKLLILKIGVSFVRSL